MSIVRHSRREFLQLSGVAASGLLLSACMPEGEPPLDHGSGYRPNAFIAIEPDGTVIIAAARSEMGQGVRSTLPQVVADELDADWQRVRVEQAQGDARYGNQNTDGSRSIRNHYERMRHFGASARYLLLAAAAKQWSVPVGQCHSEFHRVVHGPSGRALDYGKLVTVARSVELPKDFSAPLKRPEQFLYIGKSIPHVDLEDITTGRAIYGTDVQLPGMLHAVISRCPAVGGRVRSVDASAALEVPGVLKVIEVPGRKGPPGFHPQAGVAVVASNTWSAMRGRAALKIEWDLGPNGEDDSERYLERLLESSREPGSVVREQGNVDRALEDAELVVSADYVVPYLAHATMEPPTATAWYRNRRCEVWAPTQGPQGARTHLASLLKLKERAVTINVTLLGGGFGRKSKPDYILEAGWLSRELSAPVKVSWSREDDIRHDYYHAASAQHLEAALDMEGRPRAWLQRSLYPAIGTTFSKEANNLGELGMSCTDLPYDIPNIRIEGGGPPAPLRIGWLRSVGNIQHAFAVNSFAHELAVAAGRDPGHYLLELIGRPRHVDLGKDANYRNYGKPLEEYPIDTGRLRAVTELAMAKAGWDSPLPAGRGRGVAAHRSFLSYVAIVVEVATGADGRIVVERAVGAIDVGEIVNPDRVRAQLEGGIVFGLSLALYGDISTVKGAVQQSNFHDYPVLRLNETPLLEAHLLPTENLPTGAGEPPTPPTAAALCNAVQAATGQRIRRLPLRRQGLA